METTVWIDQLFVRVRVPADLDETILNTVRAALARDEFIERLRRAVLDTAGSFPDLAPCRWELSR